MRFVPLLILAVALGPARAAAADEASESLAGDLAGDLARDLAQVAAGLAVSAEEREQLAGTLERYAAKGLRTANERSTEAWRRISSREDWEAFRDRRIAALRASLGPFPAKPENLRVEVTGQLGGPGYSIRNVVYESRPGLWVTANLYEPSDPPASMPGIILCHSHHTPKTDGELQDMAISWARRGCTVLVPDLLGHGERRQHPFVSADDYPAEPFKVGRQDYFFRYNLGIQLQLVGQSLTGWMAWDLMCGVDLLLTRPGVDEDRIILLGSVAGGGDVAAVTAALDERIDAAVIFNFGGPQPETRYPLPDDAEESFNYAGGGSWESTRNLPFSARDGFLPWVIVGSLAPRRLVYGHEFTWDRERDPVWARLQRVYGFYGAEANLVGVHGTGLLTGQPPEASHCNHIGPVQLAGIHPAFEAWFGIPPPPQGEEIARHSSAELACMTAEAGRRLDPQPLWKLASAAGEAASRAAVDELAALPPDVRPGRLRELWRGVLGDVDPTAEMKVEEAASVEAGDVVGRRFVLSVEEGVVIPVRLLRPAGREGERLPVVIVVAQEGHEPFLKRRAGETAALLRAGVAVCLADVRGTGDTRPDDGGGDRGRTSWATDLSASHLMIGRPVLGARLFDLRCVLRFLAGRDDLGVDQKRLAVWGTSLAPANGPGVNVQVPYGVSTFPAQSEPAGATLALLAALFEPDVSAVCAAGGLVSFQSILAGPFCHVPHDAVVPGVLATGDMAALLTTLDPRPLLLRAAVDGRNVPASDVASEASGAAPSDWLARALAGH